MPANLTPDYLAAEKRFREAETTEDKLAALDEMMATIPKHKGTEKMRADIKKRIAKLRDKAQQSKKSGRADEFHIEKQGAGQVALLGPPNSGKSSILARLTAAEPEIANYPFSTRKPVPGMMEFEDIKIQLVDLPPVSPDYPEGGIVSIVRNADAVVIVLDASDDELLDRIEEIREELAKSKTLVLGKSSEAGGLPVGTVAKQGFIVAAKMDEQNAQDNFAVLNEFYGNEFDIIPVSTQTGEGLERFRKAVFDILGIIRVYTKIPGKPPDLDKPFILKKGSTLLDFAAAVHKDFVKSLRFAKAWGSDIIDGTQIGRDQELGDKYIVELHT